MFEDGHATGLELLVQLKASEGSTEGESETVRLRVATYNLLWNKLQVAMLVKFNEIENEAYWVLLKDIPPPSQEHQTFTVHIPKANRLSTISWPDIQEYVRRVTNRKLAAMRAQEIGEVR